MVRIMQESKTLLYQLIVNRRITKSLVDNIIDIVLSFPGCSYNHASHATNLKFGEDKEEFRETLTGKRNLMKAKYVMRNGGILYFGFSWEGMCVQSHVSIYSDNNSNKTIISLSIFNASYEVLIPGFENFINFIFEKLSKKYDVAHHILDKKTMDMMGATYA